MNRAIALAFVTTLASCQAEPAFSKCMILADPEFQKLDWGKAERFDGGEAVAVMQGIAAEGALPGAPHDLPAFEVPKADTLYVLVRGPTAFIIRVIGHMICGDDPIPADIFTAAKLRALPRSG